MEQTSSFSALNLSEEMLRALEKKGYGWPTRVQAEAIPPLLAVARCDCQGAHRARARPLPSASR